MNLAWIAKAVEKVGGTRHYGGSKEDDDDNGSFLLNTSSILASLF